MKISVRSQLRAFFSIRLNGKISLRQAASIAYEEARGNQAFCAQAAEKHCADETPDGNLDYFAGYFAMRVPIWGAQPDTGRLELINIRAATNVHFSDGARKLIVDGESPAVFTNLQVAAKDFHTMVKIVS